MPGRGAGQIEVTTFFKEQRVKLHGKALKALNNEIFKRDKYKCVVCGVSVPSDRKFHHEPCGKDKSDEIEKGAVLCDKCHDIRHHRSGAATIRKKVAVYLKSFYREQGEQD